MLDSFIELLYQLWPELLKLFMGHVVYSCLLSLDGVMNFLGWVHILLMLVKPSFASWPLTRGTSHQPLWIVLEHKTSFKKSARCAPTQVLGLNCLDRVTAFLQLKNSLGSQVLDLTNSFGTLSYNPRTERKKHSVWGSTKCVLFIGALRGIESHLALLGVTWTMVDVLPFCQMVNIQVKMTIFAIISPWKMTYMINS